MLARLIVGDVEVKAHVPYDHREVPKSFAGRRWDPINKLWILPVEFVEELAAALRAAGLAVSITHANGNPWRSGKTSHDHRSTPTNGWADALFAALGPNLRELAFKALSRIVHPDAGGDTRLMQELNAARERAAFTRKAAS